MSHLTRTGRRPIIEMLCAITLACTFGCRRAPQAWSAGLAEGPRNVVEAWLFCDECNRGERAAVAALKDTAVAPLGRILEQFPPDWNSNLALRYGTAAQRGNLAGADSSRYVNAHLARFRSTVWSRSGLVLGDIKTPNAIAVLNAALQDSVARGYSPDVLKDLHRARLAATTTPLQAGFTATAVRFADSVWLTRTGTMPWDGDERVELVGAPFPTDVSLGFRDGNNELGFVAAALPGEYAFTVANVGADQERQYSSIRVTSFPGTPITTVRDLTSGPFPIAILQSLSRKTTPPDIVHYFRFAPSVALTVTAQAEWSGPSVVDLVWDDCANRLGPGASPAPGEVRGVIMDTSGAGIVGPSIHVIPAGETGTITSVVIAGAFSRAVPPGFIGSVRVTAGGYVPTEIVAWDGAADLQVVMRPPPATSPLSERTSGPSPTATQTIPAGTCRLLGVLKRDTTSSAPIVRLRVTSP